MEATWKIGKKLVWPLVLAVTVVALSCAPAAPAPTPTPTAKAPAPTPAAVTPEAKPKTALEQLVEAAKKEGKVVWYESSMETDIAKVAAAFNTKYPGIKVEQVRLTGVDVATRILTESEAGGPTADIGTTGPEIPYDFDKRGLLHKVNWQELGVDPKVIFDPTSLATTDTPFVVAYNTNLVKEAEAPKTWDDLLNPKWKGQIGTWVQPQFQAYLVAAWGGEKAVDWVKKFAAQKPVFKISTFPISEAVAAGELPLGVVVYHTTLPVIAKGAPIKVVFMDPTPSAKLASFMPLKGSHPNAVKLFMVWLHSAEGNVAYEAAVGRGNSDIPETKMAKLLVGKSIATFRFDQGAVKDKWLKDMGELMK